MIETAAKAIHVLVIDDDGDLNQLLGEYLVQDQFSYHQALSGEEGLAQARQLHPDVVVLDLMLPDVDGYEVCRRMTTARATCDIPVILLTCLCHRDNVKQGLLHGAWTHMPKPYEPEQLIGRIHEAAAWHEGLTRHPETGHMRIDTADLASTCRMIQKMLADLAARTAIDDVTLRQISDAFMQLVENGRENGGGVAGLSADAAGPNFNIEYTVSPATSLDYGGYVQWAISENTPGMIDALLRPDLREHDPRGDERALLCADWERFLAQGGLRVRSRDAAHGIICVGRTFQSAVAGTRHKTNVAAR